MEACDYLTKPIRPEMIRNSVKRSLTMYDLSTLLHYNNPAGIMRLVDDIGFNKVLDVLESRTWLGSITSSRRVYEEKQEGVFVIYGRDERNRVALFTLLRAAGLKPLEWGDLIEAMQTAAPYVGDVVKNGLAKAQAVVVLLTGDESVRLRDELSEGGGESAEDGFQPRPNVILEAGMSLAMNPDRTILVEVGHVRPISDILGRHVVQLDNSIGRRKALLDRLRAAGCSVNPSGSDWMTAGEFLIR
jgi:hypothetical protein